MKSFGPPRDHISGRDYSTAIRGAILTDAVIDRYVRSGYYGDTLRDELLARDREKKATKRKPRFDAMAEALKLLDL